MGIITTELCIPDWLTLREQTISHLKECDLSNKSVSADDLYYIAEHNADRLHYGNSMNNVMEFFDNTSLLKDYYSRFEEDEFLEDEFNINKHFIYDQLLCNLFNCCKHNGVTVH